MTVKTVRDEINDVDVTFVEGVVDQISFKEIANGSDKFGNTHRAGVRIGDDWVNNINIKVKDGNDPEIRFNAGTQGSPNWQTLLVGDKVKLVVSPNEYNGKIYYNGAVSKIKLIQKGEGVAAKPTSSGGAVKEAYKPKSNEGVLQGHALKGGGTLVARGLVEDLTDAAIYFHDATKIVKEWYAENNNGLDDFSVGNGAGNAVNTAVQYVESVEELSDEAIRILSDVLPSVTAHIKSTEKKEDKAAPAPKKTPEKKTPAKKPVAKKPAVKKEASPEQVDDADIPESAFEPDFDDEIPF